MTTKKCSDHSRYRVSHALIGSPSYVDIIFSFLYYLPDERMTNGANANKTLVEFLSKSD